MRQRILAFIAGSALAFSGAVATANAETAAQVTTDLGLSYNTSASEFTSTLTSGQSFYTTLNADGIKSGGWNAVVGAFAAASGETYSQLFSSGNVQIGPKNGSKNDWTANLYFNSMYVPMCSVNCKTVSTLVAAKYNIAFNQSFALTKSNGSAPTYQSFKANTTGGGHLVPGPIAGAGLPFVLGMFGFALLLRRKERDAV